MPKPERWDGVDSFVLGRWREVTDLNRAFHRTMRRMRRRLKNASEALAPRLKGDGFEIEPDVRDATLLVYRPAWCGANGEPMVSLGVAEIFPVGYYGVSEEKAYIGVYIAAEDEAQVARFTEKLRGAVESLADWSSTPDAQWPLWRYIDGWDDSRRAQLAAADQDELRKALFEQVEAVLKLERAVSAAFTQQ